MAEFVDTHCHIHFPDYELDPEEAITAAMKAKVTRIMCVGCTLTDSRLGIEMAEGHDGIWASIGLHPHEAKDYVNDGDLLQQFRNLANKPKVMAIGECGLDYYYTHSSKADQEKLLRFQLDMAVEFNKPLIFHVRAAFDDFWRIFDGYKGLRGVVHSFSATGKELEEVLKRGLYVGLNGIMTFTKDERQLDAAKVLPLDSMVLETDAPFLTPRPFRGTVCEPMHVVRTAEFLADLRGESIDDLARKTTENARKLFGI